MKGLAGLACDYGLSGGESLGESALPLAGIVPLHSAPAPRPPERDQRVA